uniref:Uncharacterized protein n=1 Tax=Angiostrongylus cantonensis TaxID=6313 RepID=A0A0K0DAL8_ANGCA
MRLSSVYVLLFMFAVISAQLVPSDIENNDETGTSDSVATLRVKRQLFPWIGPWGWGRPWWRRPWEWGPPWWRLQRWWRGPWGPWGPWGPYYGR